MKLMRHGETVIRKSLPLIEQDLHDIEIVRRSPEFEGCTEAVVLNHLVRVGIDAVKDLQMEQGYGVMAAQRDEDRAQRQATVRRRRPSWADER
ncbi:hypothetical protein [Austwickia sp. TVS 96-490-7B]|uniref:hypothetical protein n=1 Tax=Austwickia sp. TVS 96-490-7B TaxID=2830843 RepID=UPI001C59B12D|nr:hypothetical protein [Austwickia sp. TVS 96-490-7B]